MSNEFTPLGIRKRIKRKMLLILRCVCFKIVMKLNDALLAMTDEIEVRNQLKTENV